MSTRKIIEPLRLTTIIALAVFEAGCACRSIAHCVANNPDDFPSPYQATSPVTATTRLGHVVESDEGYLGVGSTECFYVTTSRKPGLENLNVTYKNTTDIGAELDAVVASGGVTVSHKTNATFVLSNLQEVTAHGIPNKNSGCFDAPGSSSFRVVTREIVAGVAVLTFGKSSDLKLNAKVPIPQAPGVEVKPELGWVGSTDGGARGSNVVIAAYPSTVDVAFETRVHVLGTTPAIGVALAGPGELDAKVTVNEFRIDTQKPLLTLRITTPMGTVANVPEGALKTEGELSGICTPGDHALTPGEMCTFWLSPGNKGFNVSWNYQMGEVGKEVVVELVAYETSFVASGVSTDAS